MDRKSSEDVPSYLIPIDGLTVQSTWSIGRAQIVGSESAAQLIAERRSVDSSQFDELLEPFFAQRAGSFVHTEAPDAHAAIDSARTAVDVLRVYQQSISQMQTGMFGIPGDNHRALVTYVALQERVGMGSVYLGDHIGWTFTDDARVDFEASVPFQFAASCVGEANSTPAQNRAQTAIGLTSQAILDTRPHMAYLNAVMAAESLLLERSPQPQAYRLARRAAYFTCGGPDNLCGRDRPACVLLKTTPTRGPSIVQLRSQRDLGDVDFRERCSEWHHALDRYDVRSEIVHDGSTRVPSRDASQILYWLTHELLPNALTWFAAHDLTPIKDLDAEINSLV